MSVKRAIDQELVSKDFVYSKRNEPISVNDDVIYPSIRYNFYRTAEKDIFIKDDDIIYKFKYKPEMYKVFNEPGYFIIKTVYYKDMRVDELNEIIDFYTYNGYMNNDLSITEKIKELRNNLRTTANIRLIYFFKESDVETLKYKKVDNFIIIPDLKEYVNNLKEIEEFNKAAIVKLFYVDLLETKEKKELNIDKSLSVPVIRTDKLKKGLYIGIDDKFINIDELINRKSDLIIEAIKDLANKSKEITNEIIGENINIKREVRKIVHEKYRDLFSLIKEQIKYENELKTAEFKLAMDKEKVEKEIELMEKKFMQEIIAKEQKSDHSLTLNAMSLLKEIFKLI